MEQTVRMETRSDIPPWPSSDPCHGAVRLRKFRDEDAAMAMELAKDPQDRKSTRLNSSHWE